MATLLLREQGARFRKESKKANCQEKNRKEFEECSFGYRKGRSVKKAVYQIKKLSGQRLSLCDGCGY